VRRKYVNLTYIGKGTYSGNDLSFRYMDTLPVLVEQANVLVANFPDWWTVGDIFEYDPDEEVTIKYVGEKPYNGDGGTVNPDTYIDVTEAKARQLLADFPASWERIVDDNDETDVIETSDSSVWWEPAECTEANRVSIIVIQGQDIKNFKRLLNKISSGIDRKPKLYELFLILDEDEKKIGLGRHVDGMLNKSDEWASNISRIVDYVCTEYMFILDGDTVIPDNWDEHLQRMLQLVKKYQAAAIASLVDGVMEGELSLGWISAIHSPESADALEEVKDATSSSKLKQTYRAVLESLKQKELILNVRDLPVGCSVYKSELFKGVNGFECDRKYKGASLALRFQEAGYQCLGYTRMVVKVRSCRECV